MQDNILCFGELLLRFSPMTNGEWINQHLVPVYIGGAELNVATALANWNLPVKYFTALPDNYISDDIKAELVKRKIAISAIQKTGRRIGAYYLQQGRDLKHAAVIYDRANSSFASLKPGTIDWEKILEDVTWFHFSAICPALTEDTAGLCREVVKIAALKGIFISVDLNYRAKLWQYGKQPVEIMPELMAYCNLVMGNIWAANSLLGLPVDAAIHEKKSKDAYLAHAEKTSAAICDRFPQCKMVANTFRFDGNDGAIQYYATLYTEGKLFTSAEYSCNNVIDKIGSGDCFMAGLIYGCSNGLGAGQIVNFSAAAAVGKLQEQGDGTKQTVEQVKLQMR